MTIEQLRVRHKYETWILGSIRQTYKATKDLENESAPLAVFILISCAIDFLAGFMCGITSFNSKNSGKNYKAFVGRYLPQYDPEDIYHHIRCRLAHNYTIGEGVGLIHLKSEMHDPKGIKPGGRRIINLEDFLADFQAGANRYFDDLSTDSALQGAFSARYSLGYAGVVEIPAAKHNHRHHL